MSCKLVSILYLLWACSLVSAKENVTSKETTLKPLQNVPPQYANEQLEQQEMPVTAKMEAEKLEISDVKPLQVTGFITAGGSIFEVDDKRSVGFIQGRQNGQLLSPQPGEFICNYGSVVVYSDRPCADVMSMEKQKQKTETPNKSVQTETDKPTDQKQTQSVASEQTQADDNSADATAMGTKDEQMNEEQQKPMAPKKQKTKKNKKKKIKKSKKKSKKTKKRKQNGVQRIRVKTKIVKRPSQQQLQTQPLRRPQSNRRTRPHPRPRPQQKQQQSQRRLQNRRFSQLQANGGLFTTSNGKIYELVKVAN